MCTSGGENVTGLHRLRISGKDGGFRNELFGE